MPLSSYYSVVRYVPDVIRDEGINIGVLLEAGTNGDRRFVHSFTENFQRAAKIDPYLNTAALERNIKNSIEQIIIAADGLTLDELAARHSGSKIQITQPRFTLVENIDTELRELFHQFVWQDREERKQGITEVKLRQRVMQALFHSGIDEKRVRVNKPSDPVKVRGKRFSHTFDMSVQANGHPDFIRCLSFDVEHHTEKVESAKALIFDNHDIKAQNERVRVYSILYPPKTRVAERRDSFVEALAILRDQKIPAFDFATPEDKDRFIRSLKG
jgi:DUF3037 family protein